jgi:hypothetical protein
VDSLSRQAAREPELVLDVPYGLSQQTGSQGIRTGSGYPMWTLSADSQSREAEPVPNIPRGLSQLIWTPQQ